MVLMKAVFEAEVVFEAVFALLVLVMLEMLVVILVEIVFELLVVVVVVPCVLRREIVVLFVVVPAFALSVVLVEVSSVALKELELLDCLSWLQILSTHRQAPEARCFLEHVVLSN